MNKGMQIGEISTLFGISVPTLRYYDKIGLLSPSREYSNGYRFYGVDDIAKLTTIVFLRTIDIPIKEIETVLDEYDLDSSLELLNSSSKKFDIKIRELKKIKKNIDNQIHHIKEFRYASKDIKIKQINRVRVGRYIKKNVKISHDTDELQLLKDFIHNPERKAMDSDWLMNSKLGYIYHNGLGGIKDFVIFSDIDRVSSDFTIPKGEFLSTLYDGIDTSNLQKAGRNVQDYATIHSIELTGLVYEIWQIDDFYSNNKDSYVTELQYPINLP